MIPNVPEYSMAYFGALYAGCTVVPLNVLLSAPEVAYHIRCTDGTGFSATLLTPIGRAGELVPSCAGDRKIHAGTPSGQNHSSDSQ